ncbi:MAG TPA: hypothetical protein VJV39_07120 [Dongiaceae bacterium]|nr:hypothetical protein [Dongiaceae bacterium]
MLSVPLGFAGAAIGPALNPMILTGILVLLCIVVPIGLSPGHWMLGIQPDGSVDDEIHSGESWITLLLGFVFVQWGSTTATLWTQLDKVPLFGVMLDPALGAAIFTSWGLITILAGALFYKLSPLGLWLGIAVVLVNAVDLFVSRTAWIDIQLTRFFAAQPPGSPLAGGSFNAESVSYGLTPWFGGILAVGSTIAVLMMILSFRRLTRTG